MALLRLPTPGFDLQAQLSLSQFAIPAGAGATFAAAGNIMTVTFNAAHGLTLNPAAGVPPNYFITFGGSTSGLTGAGVLVGNIFRILTIPSTTSITIYGTITAATVTSMTGIPIFFPPFTASPGSGFASPQPSQTVATVTTSYPQPNLEGAYVMAQFAANARARINPLLDAVILDGLTTASLTGGNTPATAPVWKDIGAVSTNFNGIMMPPWSAIWADGTTATSTISVLN
jgi:hypothetical protein